MAIGRVLASHGWEYLLGRLGLDEAFRVRQQALGVPPGPVQVRESLEELGPTFIKLGQLLSTRPDIVPEEYAKELEKLQDEAPPVPISAVYEVVDDEFEQSAKSLYATFDPEPLASASLGQTHLATLVDGREVVVKVQRPGITGLIDTDLEILSGVANFLDRRFPNLRVFGLPDLVDEFCISIHQELDYIREGRNGDKLRENFNDWPKIRIAETIWDYTTTRVLTMERICGIKISDIAALDAAGYDRNQLASCLSRAFLKMVLVDGFFHSDPHPGNLVVLENSVLGILDYGQVGRLDVELKNEITALISHYVEENSAGFAETITDIGSTPPDLNRFDFYRDMDRLLRQYYDIPVSEVQLGDMLRRSMQLSARYGIRLPSNVALLAKAVVVVESVDKKLDPNFNLADHARPFIERSIRHELSFDKVRDQFYRSLLSWKNLLVDLPHRTAEVLDSMSENRFRIIFRHEGLEAATKDIDRSANRLSLALIGSATIVASAWILASEIGPEWNGFSIVGLIGFGISFIFAVWLIISILRAGKLW